MANPADESELARFGVVDIGSHTVRLVVFDGRTRSPAYFFNEKSTCALGAEIQTTGALYPEGNTLKAKPKRWGRSNAFERSQRRWASSG